MSSRQLRKLQKQRELEGKISQEAEDGDEVEEEEGPSTPKPRVNLFAALGGGDEDVPEDEDEDEQGQDAEDAQQEMKEAPVPASGKKSKKKKKKKKAKAAAAAAITLEASGGGEQSGEDEIDKAIKELQIKPQHGDASSAANSVVGLALKSNQLLKINPYHLKAIHEMRTLFGRDVIESANAEEEQEHNRRVRRTGMQQDVDLETFLRELPGAKKLPEVSLRRNIFVQGREYWPLRTAGGLTMKEVGKAADGSSTEYAYLHDKEYDGVEIFFFTCVQAGDPMRMVHLLKQVPYHISTLLQVSFVAKQDQNMALAAELCERALFTFGRVTTSSFRQNIEQGKARLDFRRPENRQFWLAVYHYIRSLIRKGTYRTALEWTKLLYSLDPMDPYAMRHYIHVLAIRAHESSWLLSFLDQLSDNRDVYLEQSRVLARLQMGDTEQARRDLTSGMQRVPWLYCALFQELNLDAPPAIWGIGAESNARMFWVKLYVQQTKDLWNNAQAIALLQDVAKNMGRVNVECLPADDAPVDLGATRLAYLEGQTSLLEVAPREFLDREPNYEFDPLPPPKAENIFTGEGTQLPWRDQHARDAGTRDYDVLERMHNLLLAQREGGHAGDGAVGFDGLGAEDEELEQDLMAQIIDSNEPGLLRTFIQMLGLDRGDSGEGSGGDAGNEIWEPEMLPGSRPVEDDDDDEEDEEDEEDDDETGYL